MRRTHLRGHENILKRLLVHFGGVNLGLLMRTRYGFGTPRGLQGRAIALVLRLVHAVARGWAWVARLAAVRTRIVVASGIFASAAFPRERRKALFPMVASTTGC
jgi:hypothetical protein